MILKHAKIWQSATHTKTVDLLNDNGQVIIGLLNPETIIEQLNRQVKIANENVDFERGLMHKYAMIRNVKMSNHHTNNYEFELNKSLALQTAIEWIQNGTMQTVYQ